MYNWEYIVEAEAEDDNDLHNFPYPDSIIHNDKEHKKWGNNIIDKLKNAKYNSHRVNELLDEASETIPDFSITNIFDNSISAFSHFKQVFFEPHDNANNVENLYIYTQNNINTHISNYCNDSYFSENGIDFSKYKQIINDSIEELTFKISSFTCDDWTIDCIFYKQEGGVHDFSRYIFSIFNKDLSEYIIFGNNTIPFLHTSKKYNCYSEDVPKYNNISFSSNWVVLYDKIYYFFNYFSNLRRDYCL